VPPVCCAGAAGFPHLRRSPAPAPVSRTCAERP